MSSEEEIQRFEELARQAETERQRIESEKTLARKQAAEDLLFSQEMRARIEALDEPVSTPYDKHIADANFRRARKMRVVRQAEVVPEAEAE